MSISVDLQIASIEQGLPTRNMMIQWLDAVVSLPVNAEVTIRIVDEEESTELNETYRKGQGSTNVLSFVHEPPPQLQSPLLGDIVICAPVIRREALQQGKQVVQHWAHMVIHGVLHLLGYDHQTETEADEMESLETRILKQLGYSDPFLPN